MRRGFIKTGFKSERRHKCAHIFVYFIYTTSIMTAKEFCDTVRYRKREADSKEESGKGKKMFTVIRKSSFYLENQENASLTRNERGFDSMCPEEIRLVQNAVGKERMSACHVKR